MGAKDEGMFIGGSRLISVAQINGRFSGLMFLFELERFSAVVELYRYNAFTTVTK